MSKQHITISANIQDLAGKTLIAYSPDDPGAEKRARALIAAGDVDLLAIKPLIPYPKNEAVKQARMTWETTMGFYPPLAEDYDLSGYDTVALLTSNQRGHLSAPVAAILRTQDIANANVLIVTDALSDAHAEHMENQVREALAANPHLRAAHLGATPACRSQRESSANLADVFALNV